MVAFTCGISISIFILYPCLSISPLFHFLPHATCNFDFTFTFKPSTHQSSYQSSYQSSSTLGNYLGAEPLTLPKIHFLFSCCEVAAQPLIISHFAFRIS